MHQVVFEKKIDATYGGECVENWKVDATYGGECIENRDLRMSGKDLKSALILEQALNIKVNAPDGVECIPVIGNDWVIVPFTAVDPVLGTA